MTAPKRLLESSCSALARKLLESGVVERPEQSSLERTLGRLERQAILSMELGSGRSQAAQAVSSPGRPRLPTLRPSATLGSGFWWKLAWLAMLVLLLGASVSYAWGPVLPVLP